MASALQTGKYGSLYLHIGTGAALASVVKVASTFDLRMEASVAMHECTRLGEGFARYMPGVGNATITCQAHFSLLSVLFAAADDTLVTGGDQLLVRCAFKLVTTSFAAGGAALAGSAIGSGTPTGQQIIQGFGWVERASLALPFDNPIVEDFQIHVDGDWQLVTST